MHQQRRLARRRRALERRRGDADDHPAAGELGQHVAQGERAGDRVELVAALDQAGRGRRVQVGAEGHDHDVAVERRRRRSRPGAATGSIDRIVVCTNVHAGLDEVAVRVDARRRRTVRPNMTSSFEKPKTKPSPWSMSVTSTSSPSSSDRRGRQLETAEPGTQHQDPHRSSSPTGQVGPAGGARS